MLKHRPPYILFLICFTLLAACTNPRPVDVGISNNPGSVPTQVVANDLSSQSILAILPTQTSAPLPDTPEPVIILTPTPLQAAASQDVVLQPTPSCTNRVEYIKALNILDNAALDAGQSFAKIWRIKNTGTCVWTTDYVLAFYSGEQMGGQTAIPLSSVVQPGETVDLRVDLVAPLNQTSYTGNWVLKDASGNSFGVGEMGNQSISVTILVKPSPMPTSG
jgi:Ig-like domain from next to BRCA1 gene